MHLNPAEIGQSSIIWVLVADPWQAQIYRYHQNKMTTPMHDSKRQPYEEDIKHHDLTLVPGMVFHVEPPDEFQTERDELGAPIALQDAEGSGERYSAVCDELMQKMVTTIAAKLKHAFNAKGFNNLMIAAPLKVLEAFKQQLEPSIVNCVIAEIDNDFEHDKKRALLAHLKSALMEARVA